MPAGTESIGFVLHGSPDVALYDKLYPLASSILKLIFAPPLLQVPSVPVAVTSGGVSSSTVADAVMVHPLLSVIRKS